VDRPANRHGGRRRVRAAAPFDGPLPPQTGERDAGRDWVLVIDTMTFATFEGWPEITRM
jgi:hypothetical protein